MTARCPSDFALEAHLLTHGHADCSPHVEHCAHCQARLVRMEQEGSEFHRSVFPATIDKVLAARRQVRPFWARPALWLPAAGIAASIFLIVRTAGPGSDYVGLKGRAIELSVFAKDSGPVKSISDGALVAADAELRFKFRTEQPCRLWVISVDSSGEVSRLYPAEGADGELAAGTTELPGGAFLDGKAGPERLFAICTAGGLSFDEVAKAARRTIQLGEPSVRAAKSITGLPSGTLQTTLLLEKRTNQR
ncbi:MAG TPA: DUF4384 domain-containing protein [Myxococcaceae bacterium]|nr:DUF4384 domain-containing protein [Myxococcaceae bacterium]